MKLTIFFIPVLLVIQALNVQVTFGARCVDTYGKCQEWMKQEYCVKFAKQMEDVCCRTCKDAKAEIELKIEIALAEAEAKAAAAKAVTNEVSDKCTAPKAEGLCKAYKRKFYYNPTTKSCQEFIYGGCGGNANNFETKEECKKACVTPKCLTPTTNGDCCVFPFKYRGKTYTACTKDSYPLPWCGITPDAKEWGLCQETTTKAPPKVTTRAPPVVVTTKALFKALLDNKKAKVNGNWGSWFPFTQCSRSCGTGIKLRTRACDNPPPSNGGEKCPGSPQENRYCNKQRCPGDGNWGAWSTYGECSVKCGMGLKTRTRKCDNPAPTSPKGKTCLGPDKEDAVCQNPPCRVQPPSLGGAGSGTVANPGPIPKLPTPDELRRQEQRGSRLGPSKKISMEQMVREFGEIARRAQDDRRSIDGSWGNHGIGSSNTGSAGIKPPMNPDPIKNGPKAGDATWGSAGIDPINPKQPQNGGAPPLGSLGSTGMNPLNSLQPQNGGAPPLGSLGSAGMNPLNQLRLQNGGSPPLGSLGSAGMNPLNPLRAQNGGAPPLGSLGSAGMNPFNPLRPQNGGAPPIGTLGSAGMNPLNLLRPQNGGAPPLGSLGSAGMNPLNRMRPQNGGAPPLGSLGSAGMNPLNPMRLQNGGRPSLGSLGADGMQQPPPLEELGLAGMNPVNPFQPQNGGRPPLGSMGSADTNPLNPLQPQNGGAPPLGSLGSAGMNPLNQLRPKNGGAPPLGSLGSAGMNPLNQLRLQNGGRPPLGSLGSGGTNLVNPYQPQNGGRPPLGSMGSAGMNPENPYQPQNGRRPPLGSLKSAGMNPVNPYQPQNGGRPPLGSMRSAVMNPYRRRYVPHQFQRFRRALANRKADFGFWR